MPIAAVWNALLLLAFSTPAAATAASAPDVESLLKRSDESRGMLNRGLAMDVKVVCTLDGDKPVERRLSVKSRGAKAVATTLEPVERRGDVMVVDGDQIWRVSSTSKRPLKLSRRERMGGGLAATGDILASGFASAYAGKVTGDGEPIGGEAVWQVDLTRKSDAATYDKIRYWIGKTSGLGLKAQFLKDDGSVIREAVFKYENAVTLDGKKLPLLSEAKLEDAKVENTARAICNIAYSSAALAEVPDAEFDVKAIAERGKPQP